MEKIEKYFHEIFGDRGLKKTGKEEAGIRAGSGANSLNGPNRLLFRFHI
jgi:hypothetical protein